MHFSSMTAFPKKRTSAPLPCGGTLGYLTEIRERARYMLYGASRICTAERISESGEKHGFDTGGEFPGNSEKHHIPRIP